MKIKEYKLSLYEKAMPDTLSLKEKILTSIDLGYDSCEICIDMDPNRQERLDWTVTEIKDIKNFLSKYQIELYTLSLSALRGHTLGSLDPEDSHQSLQMIKKALIVCNALDIKVLLINTYDVYYQESTQETQRMFCRNLQRAVKLAEKYKVIIGLENAEKPFGDTAEKVLEWIKLLRSDYLKIYYDFANAYNAFNGHADLVVSDYEVAKEHVVAAHLKDSLPGEYRMVSYGKGYVDFDKMIPLLLQNNVQYYTAELFLKNEDNWREEAIQVKHFLNSFLT